MIFSYPLTWRAPIGRAGFSGLRGALFIGSATFSREAKRGARRILEACMFMADGDWSSTKSNSATHTQAAHLLHLHFPFRGRIWGVCKMFGSLLIQISFAYRKFASQHSIANGPRVALHLLAPLNLSVKVGSSGAISVSDSGAVSRVFSICA